MVGRFGVDKLPDIVGPLLLAGNVLFLAYLVVFAVARGSAELYAAVGAEFVFFALLIGYRLWKWRAGAGKVEAKALSQLEESWGWLYVARRLAAGIMVAGMVGMGVYALGDVAALICAAGGATDVSQQLYRALALPKPIGEYSAYSLKLLAGAYRERGDWEKARAAEQELMRIHRAAYGEQCPVVAEMYTALGDVARGLGGTDEAERLYKRAIELTKEIKLRAGYGSPMTKLACLYRDNGRRDEADECFRAALAIRSERLGEKSVKLAETKKEYAVLLEKEGAVTAAARMRAEADAVMQAEKKKDEIDGVGQIVAMGSCLVAMLFACFRGRVLSAFAGWVKKGG